MSMLGLSLLPFELKIGTIPFCIASFTYLIPCLHFPIRKQLESQIVLSGLIFSCILAIISSFFLQATAPILSYLSFFLPISGFFYGLQSINKEQKLIKFFQSAWLVGMILAIAMLYNLYEFSLHVRGEYGFVIDNAANRLEGGAIALGSLYGANIFGAYGINSLAGICLSFSFILFFTYKMQKSVMIKLITFISGAIIYSYGFFLESRSFYIGTFIFIFSYLYKKRMYWIITLSIIILGLLIVELLHSNNRMLSSINNLKNNDLSSLATNRDMILRGFFKMDFWALGNAFSPISIENTSSNSYHFYFFTVIAKGGIILLPCLLIPLVRPFFYKRVRVFFSSDVDHALFAVCLSFIVQSFFWDIYAVQLYGHIAWIFSGVFVSTMYEDVSH